MSGGGAVQGAVQGAGDSTINLDTSAATSYSQMSRSVFGVFFLYVTYISFQTLKIFTIVSFVYKSR